jgi:hypothetical protein
LILIAIDAELFALVVRVHIQTYPFAGRVVLIPGPVLGRQARAEDLDQAENK